MERIASFKIDHNLLKKGVYISRLDGDIITYDLRMCAPYVDPLLTNSELHSFEHMLATVLRNSSEGRRIVYVGPMGCQTGFYVLTNALGGSEFLAVLKKALQQICQSQTMYGASRIECGNADNLSLAAAKKVSAEYLEVIKDKACVDNYN